MTLISLSGPLLQEKQEDLDYQDLKGLWRFNAKVGNIELLSGFYTRIDQVFIVWGLVCASMFLTAQFLPIGWQTQAKMWSILSILGTGVMTYFTWFWVSVERLRWLIYSWIILMLGGVLLTDLGIFLGWGQILMNLCPLWLGLSAIGYLITAFAVRSRTFLLTMLVHLFGIAILPIFMQWQFLITGLVIASSLFLLAQMQWDMRPPIDYDVLSAEQKQFNQEQQQRRMISLPS